MNSIKQLNIIGIIFIFMLCNTTQAMNISRPHDIFFRPPAIEDQWMQFYAWTESGLKQTAYTKSSNTINELKCLNNDQDALAMLNGFEDQSIIGQTRAQLNVVNDGTRGHYCVTGDISSPINIALGWRMFFGHNITLGIYLPVHTMKLKNSCWIDQTKMIDNQDAQVHALLTNNFFNTVKTLSNGLELGDWKRAGVGDLEIILEFLRNFPQDKPMLKNVLLNLRGGLTFPTGTTEDVNKTLALPFGADGATTAIFGGGIELQYGSWFKFGFDVELIHLFGNTKEHRIKTSPEQTEFLLLQKTKANKDWGMQQQFTLFTELHHFLKGFSFKLGYRFFKQGDSTLALCGNEFSNQIANSAKSIKNWTAHDILLKLSYDFSEDYEIINPGFAIFTQIPCNGKRSILSNTLGVMISVDF